MNKNFNCLSGRCAQLILYVETNCSRQTSGNEENEGLKTKNLPVFEEVSDMTLICIIDTELDLT